MDLKNITYSAILNKDAEPFYKDGKAYYSYTVAVKKSQGKGNPPKCELINIITTINKDVGEKIELQYNPRFKNFKAIVEVETEQVETETSKTTNTDEDLPF